MNKKIFAIIGVALVLIILGFLFLSSPNTNKEDENPDSEDSLITKAETASQSMNERYINALNKLANGQVIITGEVSGSKKKESVIETTIKIVVVGGEQDKETKLIYIYDISQTKIVKIKSPDEQFENGSNEASYEEFLESIESLETLVEQIHEGE